MRTTVVNWNGVPVQMPIWEEEELKEVERRKGELRHWTLPQLRERAESLCEFVKSLRKPNKRNLTRWIIMGEYLQNGGPQFENRPDRRRLENKHLPENERRH